MMEGGREGTMMGTVYKTLECCWCHLVCCRSNALWCTYGVNLAMAIQMKALSLLLQWGPERLMLVVI